jgi:hypothetical protein
MKAEVPVKIQIVVFWVTIPCNMVGRYQLLGGIYCRFYRVLTMVYNTQN